MNVSENGCPVGIDHRPKRLNAEAPMRAWTLPRNLARNRTQTIAGRSNLGLCNASNPLPVAIRRISFDAINLISCVAFLRYDGQLLVGQQYSQWGGIEFSAKTLYSEFHTSGNDMLRKPSQSLEH